MKEILGDIPGRRVRGEKAAIVTTVATRCSAPRPVAATPALASR